jgi:hypothetical protein
LLKNDEGWGRRGNLGFPTKLHKCIFFIYILKMEMSDKTDKEDATGEINTPTNIFNESVLEKIKNKIENMTKFQHIEVLKIIKKNKTIKINENKNGVYINMSYLPKKTINELETYIKYIDDQTAILKNQ